MTITKEPFGSHDGETVAQYTIRNADGLTARIITFGARLTQMSVPGRDGTMADIVLGFDDVASYAATDTYFGATCGRYGNRIKDGHFILDGEGVQVTRNEGSNHLHGGQQGFDKRIWTAYPNEADDSVTFSLVSHHDEEGFPGDLAVTAKYTLTGDNRLLIAMSGVSERATILNMVHHSYWNVAGHASGNLFDQHLTVEADFYTPVDAQLMTTGEVLKVAGSPFDFSAPKPIGRDLHAVANAGVGHLEGGGYDHNWVLRGSGPGLRPVATLWDPKSGRGFDLASTEPGVQIYTGGYLSASVIGKGAQAYCPYAGLTFETQKFPDSPNFAHFPTTRVSPGEVYDHRMAFRFFSK